METLISRAELYVKLLDFVNHQVNALVAYIEYESNIDFDIVDNIMEPISDFKISLGSCRGISDEEFSVFVSLAAMKTIIDCVNTCISSLKTGDKKSLNRLKGFIPAKYCMSFQYKHIR